MISIATPTEVLTTSQRFLSVQDDGALSVTYVAAALRRFAGAVCPCSPKTLLKVMVDSHRHLVSDSEGFASQVEVVIEDLVSVGDLLELTDVASVDERIKGTWLFPAPPGFVIHHGGVAHIIGLSTDEQTPLPVAIRDRVVLKDVSRRILPGDGENLGPFLKLLGLREISSDSWLRRPRLTTAPDLVTRVKSRLSSMERLGDQDGIQVFNHLSDRRSYRRCWEQLANQSGQFVIRRPQAYGADRWGYAEMAFGQIVKVLEFPETGDRWRGCDVAWRLMMALLSLEEHPVTYCLEKVGDSGVFDFFFPIPDWAKRSLRFAGEEVPARACLMSFDIPVAQVVAVQRFLAEMLFLAQQSD